MKKFNRCIDLCDRLITLDNGDSQKGLYAVRCKTECKRLLAAEKAQTNTPEPSEV